MKKKMLAGLALVASVILAAGCTKGEPEKKEEPVQNVEKEGQEEAPAE